MKRVLKMLLLVFFLIIIYVYTLLIESFGSADGIYYGLNSSDQLELKFTVSNAVQF